ncbi:hypothetical protein SANA_10590 [Gottschalkiaceae bacterium SANA]|nr:hypothetical protein SANA_10590 [Gottschalkiaceae bacterium SANA]
MASESIKSKGKIKIVVLPTDGPSIRIPAIPLRWLASWARFGIWIAKKQGKKEDKDEEWVELLEKINSSDLRILIKSLDIGIPYELVDIEDRDGTKVSIRIL